MNNSPSEESDKTQPSLLTVRQFSKKHDWPVGGLRHLLFQRPSGFNQVVRRVGRKVLIHEAEFFRWVERINRGSSGGAK